MNGRYFLKTLFLFFLLIQVLVISGQSTITKTFHSHLLNEDRVIRIHLPKGFTEKNDRKWPLILTLDGEYMFYALTGNTEMLSSAFADRMPEVVVVGIDQNYVAEKETFARWIDCDYGSQSGLPERKGILFREFIDRELLPWLEKKYHTGKFRLVAGHSFTANYINYLLIETPRLFNAFIALSPYIPEAVNDTLFNTIRSLDKPVFYYLCTAENDLSGHKKSIVQLDSLQFRTIRNSNFHYSFRNYDAESHLSLVARALPDALRFVFSVYAPIDEVSEAYIKSGASLTDYLKQKYDQIQSIYDIRLPYREDDLLYISSLAEELEYFDQLEELGKMTITARPELPYGYYMLGTVEEKRRNLTEALEYYKTGFGKLSHAILNKADFYLDIERVERMIKESSNIMEPE